MEETNLISDAIDKIEIITLKYVVTMLEKYPVSDVIGALKNEVKEKEAKLKA